MRSRRAFVLVSFPAATMIALLASCGGEGPTEPPARKEPPAGTQKTSPRPTFATSSNGEGMSITTDKDDYAPGDTVLFTGAGWSANDTLDIVLDDDPATHPPHKWTIPTRADGTFRDSTYVVDVGDIGVTFTLTATSRADSTQRLTVTFTDGNLSNVSITFFPGGSTSGTPPNACTGASGSSVTVSTPICARASFTITAPPNNATAVSIRWRNPSNAIVAVNVRSPDFPSSVTGNQAFAAAFTPTVTGTWTALLCESGNTSTSGGGATGCAGGPERGSATFTVVAVDVPTTTSISSSQNPSASGDPVTFTATVTSGSPAVPVTTGSVAFRDGTCAAGTILSGPTGLNGSGQAAFTTSTLSLGSHTIRACYGGAAGFLASEGSVVQTVNNTATEVDLASSHNPSVTGQSVSFTATVTNNSNPVTTGQVTFKKGGTTCANASQVQAPQTPNGLGKATYTTSFDASDSPITIRACYGGSSTPVLGASEAALVQNVNPAATSAVVTSNHNPSVFSQPLTFDVTVSVTSPGAGTPAGYVTLKDGTCGAGTPLGSTALNGSGEASFNVSTIGAGAHTISACYAGNADFNSSSGSVAQTVNKAETSTTVASSANPAVFSQPVTFTVTVTPDAPALTTPVGNVTLVDGTCASGTTIGASTALNGSGQASFNVSTLGVGPHTITACYGGNVNFNGSSGSVAQTVNKAQTSTAVTSSDNPSVFSQTVTFTVTVTPDAPALATPVGNVTLKNGTCAAGATLGGPTALTASGQASFNVSSLVVGTHTITGCYSGNMNFEPSDGFASQTVDKASTTTTITSSVSPSILAQPVTFHLTASPVAPAVATPQGNVTLKDGTCATGTALGSAALNGSGEASFNVSSLPVGLHTVSACYGGNESFNGSDGSVNQVVQYNFAGLFDPVDRPNTMNLSKAGQGVPLKWRLTDFTGAPVLNFAPAALGVAVTGMPCEVSAALDQIENYAGNSGLQNLGDGYYQFNWKTPVSYANSCKGIGLNLGEGSTRGPLAYFNFKK